MAAALRKITQNYDWTLKRADNDRHNVITPQPPTPSPSSPSYPDIKPVDSFGAFPWDENYLRWKLGTDYEELREHLGRSFFILLGLTASIYHLLMAATTHFLEHHISSVFHLHKEHIKLPNLDVSLRSIWSLSVSLFRSAASLIVSLLWETICFFVPHHVKMYAEEGTGTRFASWLLGQPVLSLVPVKGLKGLSGAQPPTKNAGNSTSDPTQSQLTVSLADNLKIGIKAMHSMANDEARRLFHRKYNYGYPENLYEYANKFAETAASYRSFLS